MARTHLGRGLGTVVEERAPNLGMREIRLLGPYMRPYRRLFIGAAVLMLVSSALKLIGPILLRSAIDFGISAGDLRVLNMFGAGFVVAAFISFITLRKSSTLMGEGGEKVLWDLRVSSFRHLMGLSIGFFERERSGRLVARITSDIEAVEQLVTESLVRILTEVVFIAGAGVVLFVLDWRLALAGFTVLPLMALMTRYFRRRSDQLFREVRERIASVLSFIQETLRGVHVVQAFGTERVRSRRFHAVNDDWADANVDAFKLQAAYFPTMQFFGVIGTAIVLLYGGARVAEGSLDVGMLTAFAVYLTLFFEPINHLSELYARFQQAMAGLARVAQLLEVEPDIVDDDEAVDIDSVEGRVELRKVSFAYRPDGPMVLENIDLEVEPGATVALVGPTGAGKSTIVKLIARFYDTSRGSIHIDGRDVKTIKIEPLRSHMALVPQEGFIFSGTVRDNIRFGKPDASDTEIESICDRLGIDDFIRSLPDSYDTKLREKGSRLAAGERQLIGLARAAIADPRIIILDEATSSLDSATEHRVDQAFSRAMTGRTSVVIAHRLSTVMAADQIHVIDHGRIVESGTHAELVEAGGRYAALYHAWLTPGEEEAVA